MNEDANGVRKELIIKVSATETKNSPAHSHLLLHTGNWCPTQQERSHALSHPRHEPDMAGWPCVLVDTCWEIHALAAAFAGVQHFAPST